MKNWIIGTLSILLIGTNIFWLYVVIDEAVAHNYHQVSYQDLVKEENVYHKISTHFMKNLSHHEVEKLAYKLFSHDTIRKDSNSIYVDDFKLKSVENK